jgi:hypothetical protein
MHNEARFPALRAFRWFSYYYYGTLTGGRGLVR